MSTSAVRVRVDEFEKMIDAGVFESDGLNDRRIELIFGEMIEQMVPPNPPHESVIDWLTEWSFAARRSFSFVARIQNSVGLARQDSIVLPDVAWLRHDENYRARRPTADDVQLVIEVADSSLRTDLGDKAQLYASAGIADYWVVDVRNLCVHVHRDPVEDRYQSIEVHQVGHEISPLVHPAAVLKLSDLFAQ